VITPCNGGSGGTSVCDNTNKGKERHSGGNFGVSTTPTRAKRPARAKGYRLCRRAGVAGDNTPQRRSGGRPARAERDELIGKAKTQNSHYLGSGCFINGYF